MTGTPPATPNESDETPSRKGDERQPTRSGHHQNTEPTPHSAGAGNGPEHGRHEMPGPRGYPQFEGPGAAQYGSEPVEPPPPMPSQGSSSGPGMPPPPGYGQPPQSGASQGQPPQPGPGQQPYGAGQAPGQQYGAGQPYGAPTQPGAAAQSGATPPGAPPSGAPGSVGSAQPGGPHHATGEKLDVGRAIAYGWDRFRLNPVPWLGIVMVGLIAYLVVVLLVNIADVQSLSVVLLVFAIASLMVWLLQAAMIRGALYETDGTPTDFPSFFGFVNAGNVLLTALIVLVGCFLASLACVFPAVIVGVLCMFALNFVIDQDMSPIEAIKSSAQLVIRNPVPTVLLALVVAVMTTIGALLCGLGLLIAGPVSAIAVTYAYRTLTGGLVAPL
ncbi:hypothetical protein IU501_20315 [Nocardia otitidiscaviarum]|uniref:hypothetical protein n=1 Tax=Nocardia otitidiscaviarum TaxID=1823 RepID=UPI0004A74C56|nr:hypothetical protein [Nocardia otitidiscaviarum]MBF6135333.1 hypothetical protein [Nocardia otitidiscaviarum]MBF6487154.1 hypothetical protein [Nocardia otitidiscaviarum]